ncbi:MAG: response regulator [Nitrospirota bacterium]|nr:response regulator [Nitrospirota bacterium]MDP2383102.1 response regulator [Nitrospirota bacterium]MDP3595843.1 response regulator [Nitrospirota bacterium]
MATVSSQPSVLIVEDQEGPRKALCMILSSFYRIYMAETAFAALKIISESHMDLVIMDVGLPDISGIELLRRVRASGQAVKVIVVTGRGSLESAEEAMRLGAVAYLLKPFNLLEVLDLVQQGVRTSAAELALRLPMITRTVSPG